MTGKVEVTLTVNGRKFRRRVQPRYLLTETGVGYRLLADEDSP